MKQTIHEFIFSRKRRSIRIGIVAVVILALLAVIPNYLPIGGAFYSVIPLFVLAVAIRFIAEDLTIIIYGQKQNDNMPIRPNKSSEEYLHNLLHKERLQNTSVGAKMEVVFVCGIIISTIVGILAESFPIAMLDVKQLFFISAAAGVWAGYAKGKTKVDETMLSMFD